MNLKIWFLETRPQFLLLSVVLAFLGTAIAWYDGAFYLGYALLALLTLPFAIKAIRGALHPEEMSKLVPAMANNVLVVLLTQLLMGVGYLLAES